MIEAAPELFYIVGRNVSAGQMSTVLSEKLKSNLLWLQTEKDRSVHKDSLIDHHWVLVKRDLSSSVQNELLKKNYGFALNDISFFFSNHQKVFLSELTSSTHKTPKNIHPAILARIQALSLFNDFTPYLWEQGRRGAQLPDAEWIVKNPRTAALANGATYALFNRSALLKALSDACLEAGAKVELSEKAALGVQHLGKDGHRVVFNAPNEPQTVSKILWMSRGDSLQEEHSSEKQKIKKRAVGVHPIQEQIGRWVSFETSLPLRLVAALPLMSVWIDQTERGRGLLTSGRLSSNSIRRLFVFPEANSQSGIPHARMILQELEMDESFDESFQVNASQARESFLWSLNPALKLKKLDWTQLPGIDEEILYFDPISEWEEVASGCWVMPAKPSLDAIEIEKRVINQLKAKSKEKAV
jgi:hypothetical protein